MLPVLATAFLGWALGVLVNYLADILPIKRKIVLPFCLHCEAEQNLFNYGVWQRRCPECGTKRGYRTWIVEIVFILAAVYLWVNPTSRLPFLLGLVWLVYFGVVTVIDLEHRLIMHPVSLVGVLLALPTGVWLHGLKSTFLGGAAGFGIMLGLYYLGMLLARLLARWRGEFTGEEALGFGDVNLSGVLGLLLGWPGVAAGLILTILIGGAGALVYMLLMRAKGEYRSDMAIPYGPFLVISAAILIYFRNIF